MYKFFLFLIAFLGSVALLAQNINKCGTPVQPEMMSWLKKHIKNPVNYRDEDVYMPIQFHLVAKSDSTGYFTANGALNMLCDVNEQYKKAKVGFQFYNNGAFNFINKDEYYVQNFLQGYQMFNQYNFPNVINVYLVEDPDGRCGYFGYGADGIAIAKSCAGEASTVLAHELGHFFSLPHTFSGWENQNPPSDSNKERANGSNCSESGDNFCDTPADYFSEGWQCPYNGNPVLDPDQQAIDPDGSLFMAYSSDNCQNRFSPQQLIAMNAYLNQVRTNLLNYPKPNTTPVGDSYAVYPANGDLKVPYNNVLLTWTPAFNAQNYYLDIRTGNKIVFSNFVNNNLVVFNNFKPNTTYVWTVKPLSKGYYCATGISNTFKTTNSNVLHLNSINVVMPLCSNPSSGSITPSISGGLEPYEYQWNNGTTLPVAENIIQGNYYLTITDQQNDTLKLKIKLPAPPNFSTKIVQTNNNTATAQVSGGSLPYTYLWSNQETTQTAVNLPTQNVHVIVKDAFGCTDTAYFNIADMETQIVHNTCYNQNSGSINLSISNGSAPFTYHWSTGSTANNINQLEAGQYSLSVKDADNNELQLYYEIMDPIPLQAKVSVSDNNASVAVAGGTPDYLFLWDTEYSIYDTISNLPPNHYKLTVTDFYGCEVSKEFDIYALAVPTAAKAAPINLYPNLISTQQTLNLQAKQLPNTLLAISCFNSSRQQVFTTNVSTNSQSYANFKLPLNLSNGLYTLQIIAKQNNNISTTQHLKFMLLK